MTVRAVPVGAQLLAGALFSLSASADVIDTSSQEPWERCAYCHGIDGISSNTRFPNLAGQTQAYLSKQLRDFRDGRRTNDGGVMQTQAAGLDAEKIRVLAEYFSKQAPPAPKEGPTK
jgi:cytochrome c553